MKQATELKKEPKPALKSDQPAEYVVKPSSLANNSILTGNIAANLAFNLDLPLPNSKPPASTQPLSATNSIQSSHSISHSLTLQQSEDLSTKLGFSLSDTLALERTLFTCINEDNRQGLLDIFEEYPNDTDILQILLTTTYPNRDAFYRHDGGVVVDAEELLGLRYATLCDRLRGDSREVRYGVLQLKFLLLL